jgi:hypothetical protein
MSISKIELLENELEKSSSRLELLEKEYDIIMKNMMKYIINYVQKY